MNYTLLNYLKKQLFDKLELFFGLYCIIYIFLWRAILIGFSYAFLPFIIFILLYLYKRKDYWLKLIKKNYVLFLFLLIYVSIVSFKNFNYILYYKNVIQLILPGIFIPILLADIFKNKSNSSIEKLLKNLFYFSNTFFWINTFIIILQLKIPYFMMRQTVSGNTFYLDHLTGLFGLSATHILGLFYIALLLLNEYIKMKINTKMFSIYNLICLIIMLWTSSKNDNKFFLFLFFMYSATYLIIKNYNYILKHKFIFVLSASISVLLVFIFCLICAELNILPDFIENIYNSVIIYIESIITSNTSQGSERLMLVQYSLTQNGNLFIGQGLSSVYMLYPDNMPLHFGMNDYSSLIYVSGIIGAMLVTSVYVLSVNACYKKVSHLIQIVNIIYTIIMFFYTNILTVPAITILYISINFILGRIKEESVNKNRKKYKKSTT